MLLLLHCLWLQVKKFTDEERRIEEEHLVSHEFLSLN